MKNRKLGLQAFVLALGLLVAVGSAWAPDTVKIGVLGPGMGPMSATYRAFEDGIKLAAGYVNAKGGVLGKKLEIVFEDTVGAPEKAASGFESLVKKHKVVMVLGEGDSSSASAEIEVADRFKVPLIVSEAWTDPINVQGSRYVFRAGPSNFGVINDNIAKWVAAEKFKKAYIIAENTEWGSRAGELAAKALAKAGGKIEAMTTERESQDHYAELSKIQAFDPDVILAFIYGTGLHYFVAQAGEVKLTPKAVILDGAGLPSRWPEYWKNVGDFGNLECFVSSRQEKVELTRVASEYREAYQKVFGSPPTDYTFQSIFDSCLIASDAINRADSTDPDKLVDALEKTNLLVTRGTVTFGTDKDKPEYHQWTPPMMVIQWQNKEQVVIYPPGAATGKLVR